MSDPCIEATVKYYFSARTTSGRALTVSFLLRSFVITLLYVYGAVRGHIIDFCHIIDFYPVCVGANEDFYM